MSAPRTGWTERGAEEVTMQAKRYHGARARRVPRSMCETRRRRVRHWLRREVARADVMWHRKHWLPLARLIGGEVSR